MGAAVTMVTERETAHPQVPGSSAVCAKVLPEVRERLVAVATERGVRVGDVIRQAIHEHLDPVGTAVVEEPAETVQVWRSPAVVEVTGVSYRQLDYWTTTGRLTPVVHATGSGSTRLYDRSEIVRLALVGTLVNAGFGVGLAFRCIDDPARRHAALLLADAAETEITASVEAALERRPAEAVRKS